MSQLQFERFCLTAQSTHLDESTCLTTHRIQPVL